MSVSFFQAWGNSSIASRVRLFSGSDHILDILMVKTRILFVFSTMVGTILALGISKIFVATEAGHAAASAKKPEPAGFAYFRVLPASMCPTICLDDCSSLRNQATCGICGLVDCIWNRRAGRPHTSFAGDQSVAVLPLCEGLRK